MKRHQTQLELAARDHNWLLGQIRAAEVRFNHVIDEALGYIAASEPSKRAAFQRAVSSMAQNLRDDVRARFTARRTELSSARIVEPVHDFTSPNSTQEHTA